MTHKNELIAKHGNNIFQHKYPTPRTRKTITKWKTTKTVIQMQSIERMYTQCMLCIYTKYGKEMSIESTINQASIQNGSQMNRRNKKSINSICIESHAYMGWRIAETM